MKCSIDAAMHQEFIERERVYDFLVGLNVELDQVRVQIHGKEPLPSLNEAFAIVKGEGRRNIMLKKGNTIDNFALAISKPSGNEEVLATNAANSGRNERKKTSEKDSLWCSYCKKNRHTRETCWKLHGKPLNFFKGNGGKGVNSGYKSQANLAEIGGKQQEENFGQEMELNKEEIDKLKRFISKLEKPEGHSYFAQTGKYSFSLSASKIQFSSPWIIDSGASDLTTNSSKVFSNYIPCSGNQKIKIADGTLVTVVGQGDVFLTSSLTLRNVLHVPKLSVNLLSIPQITKDLNCSVNFTTVMKISDFIVKILAIFRISKVAKTISAIDYWSTGISAKNRQNRQNIGILAINKSVR